MVSTENAESWFDASTTIDSDGDDDFHSIQDGMVLGLQTSNQKKIAIYCSITEFFYWTDDLNLSDTRFQNLQMSYLNTTLTPYHL